MSERTNLLASGTTSILWLCHDEKPIDYKEDPRLRFGCEKFSSFPGETLSREVIEFKTNKGSWSEFDTTKKERSQKNFWFICPTIS